MFKSCVIIRKPRSTLYSYWLSVNLPNLMLSVLSLIDAKPNTLVEYVKRTGAALARNKGSDGKVSTRQLTSWRLGLMWLCWCDSVDWGYWLTMVKALYWQMKGLLKHALLSLNEAYKKICLGYWEEEEEAEPIWSFAICIQYCIVQCWDWSLPIFIQSYSIGDINSNVNILEENDMQMDIKWH